ncbi:MULTISPECIES: M35 family metallo-endopeptidase [Burkholderia]|uniref:Lysine-specific metallo-endopeptidase family protein n=1 Tax=Burkholderia pyrrocinia TaxID=60550 RepID=A0A318IM90_BURPY|nr:MULTISPECIES: M35 family metallo-endopeptidase [Burkholderia]PXX32288.1 lysine-specific metallo-endopeptidase family protein [Burkholderia pyrrocinia]SFW80272.1 Lysine-specific metallo-endopeptidase [Burkholderia sp. NFACC33-1]SFY40818.1 Lysine-specific metallo-endopeptidase [Burkholderia sp. NFPP32]
MRVDNRVEIAEAVTDTIEGSMIEALISNGPPICPNMTDAEFRRTVLTLRDSAVKMIDVRLADLSKWGTVERERVVMWFGSSDEAIRQRLSVGLSAVSRVMHDLKPGNFVRQSERLDRYLGCTPNNKNPDGVVAHVCGPDTATHTICIHENFCEMRAVSSAKDSMLSTLIHECTHFVDTFGSHDHRYSMRECLTFAKTHPELAIDNADSIAGYVVYEN